MPLRQLARKFDESSDALLKPLSVTANAITVNVDSNGTITLDPSPGTTVYPASTLVVVVAAPYNAICARTGVIINADKTTKDEGTCQCANVVGAVHMAAGVYSVSPGAGGPTGQDYKLVPLKSGVLCFGSTGDIHIGS